MLNTQYRKVASIEFVKLYDYILRVHFETEKGVVCLHTAPWWWIGNTAGKSFFP